jgi:hypothetical protein
MNDKPDLKAPSYEDLQNRLWTLGIQKEAMIEMLRWSAARLAKEGLLQCARKLIEFADEVEKN